MLNSLRARFAAARGRAGEDAAEALLRRDGWRVLARNWRQGRHELDLVCEDGDDLVFVEVRTRAENGLVSPAESVTPAKRRNLVRAARAYLAAHKAWDRGCRFDVVCVTAGTTIRTEHIRDAFELDQTLDRGHAPRQRR